MNKELTDYIKEPENDIANFNLAYWYESQKHLSPACSYYLRCAELTKDENLAYECLLRLYLCYYSLSNRDYTCENLLKSGLKIKPKNPEAYFFLSQFYERKQNWMDGYLYASLGLDLSDCEPSKFNTSFEYQSKYMLIFQKAVCSWWYGKPKESRILFRKLKDEYGSKLNDNYYHLVQNNLSTLGSGSVSESEVKYDKSKYDLLGINVHEELMHRSTEVGHYISAIKNKYNNKWYIFNDSCEPHHLTQNQLQNTNAYMLFYIRKD